PERTDPCSQRQGWLVMLHIYPQMLKLNEFGYVYVSARAACGRTKGRWITDTMMMRLALK
ncbi:MAG: hypothetical protein ACRYFY_13610, partial [Janthinobacterium lividum]